MSGFDAALTAEVTDLLHREAYHLDRCEWDRWLALYTDDAIYWAPALSGDDGFTDDPDNEISLIYLDRAGIEARVFRIESGDSFANTPLPMTAHLVTNVRVVDAGVASPTADVPELLKLHLGPGTADITEGPAMSRETAEGAVAAGIRLFEDELTSPGVDIVACGEMGIGNTTSAAAIVATVTGRPPASVTGRGTGVDDEAHATKVRAIETALSVNQPDPQDGIGLLAAIGGFEIGVLAGVYLGAASRRVPAVMDGLISGAAALVAVAIEPQVREYLIASHRSTEPGHQATLEALELEPLLDFGLRLGEGSGAALGITLCVAACRLLDEMATFSEAGVTDSDQVVEPER